VASPGDITEILLEWGKGDASAADRLFPRVYEQLRRIAQNRLHRRTANPTLDAKAMRHILVDRARRRNAAKQGGGDVRSSLLSLDGAEASRAVEILELD
jgi:ECF sigma factor